MIATQLKQHQREATHCCTVLSGNVRQFKHNYPMEETEWCVVYERFKIQAKLLLLKHSLTCKRQTIQAPGPKRMRNTDCCVFMSVLNSNKTNVMQENKRNQCFLDERHTTQTTLSFSVVWCGHRYINTQPHKRECSSGKQRNKKKEIYKWMNI